ncbi:MAG TPA: PQQ-binding-like beta-propeller repeat protein [Acetobacteraceae bacterium]|nr:PQQ-binding-like beta-propeller repeat protein [Acetobacteraceae bacterium]
MRFLAALLLFLAAGLGARAAAPAGASVLTYHGDPARSGNYVVPGLTWRAAQGMRRDGAFDGAVEGHVYAQPLYWRPPGGARGMIIVATESDVVQALDEGTGHTIWRVALGRPVARAALPCGNIDPLGITGTPVIDPANGALFLDAMVDRDGVPAHLVFGLSLADGHVLAGWPVDVQAALRERGIAFTPREQNQRAALALLDGRVFVAFGGNWGDCGRYHGIVLGLDEAPPHAAVAWSTRALKGGIWAPGGIAEDEGALFVATGNTDDAESWGDGEGVFRLGPGLIHSLDRRDFYAPRNWKELDDDDLDMSGVSPLPFDLGGAHRLLALGKDGNAYLLDRDDLGGIGGQIETRHVAGGPIITAPAFFPEAGREVVAFQARRTVCPDGGAGGLAAVAVTASAVAPLWCARLDGRGSAMVTTTDGAAQPIVWIAGAEGDGRLHAFRGDTGAPLWTSQEALPGLRHFVTALVAGRRLYIAGDGRVFAFGW